MKNRNSSARLLNFRFAFLCSAVLGATGVPRADAGQEGKGGRVIECLVTDEATGKTYLTDESLDLWESRQHGYVLDLPGATYIEKVNTLIDRLKNKDPLSGAAMETYWKNFHANFNPIPDGHNPLRRDTNLNVQIPSNCYTYQAIDQDPNPPFPRKRYNAEKVWDLLDENSKAMVVAHEIALTKEFAMDIPFYFTDAIRHYVGVWASAMFAQFTPLEYARLYVSEVPSGPFYFSKLLSNVTGVTLRGLEWVTSTVTLNKEQTTLVSGALTERQTKASGVKKKALPNFRLLNTHNEPFHLAEAPKLPVEPFPMQLKWDDTIKMYEANAVLPQIDQPYFDKYDRQLAFVMDAFPDTLFICGVHSRFSLEVSEDLSVARCKGENSIGAVWSSGSEAVTVRYAPDFDYNTDSVSGKSKKDLKKVFTIWNPMEDERAHELRQGGILVLKNYFIHLKVASIPHIYYGDFEVRFDSGRPVITWITKKFDCSLKAPAPYSKASRIDRCEF